MTQTKIMEYMKNKQKKKIHFSNNSIDYKNNISMNFQSIILCVSQKLKIYIR